MKVTKLIREYVEEQVSKVYDSKVNPYSEQAKIDKMKIEALQKELATQQRETIEKFMSETPLFSNTWSGFKPTEVDTRVPSFYAVYTQAMVDEKIWEEKNIQAKNSKIRDIIVSLELGANRQELNDMLAKLLEE